jgi:hypothetical protein
MMGGGPDEEADVGCEGTVGIKGGREGVKFGEGDFLPGVLLPASVRVPGLLWTFGDRMELTAGSGHKAASSISNVSQSLWCIGCEKDQSRT